MENNKQIQTNNEESLSSEMNFDGLYNVRNVDKNDHNFIIATFLRGLYYGDSFFSVVPKNIFMNKYKQVASSLVNDPETIIRVACLIEDPNVLLGYSILSNAGDTINWCFVKSAWRNRGIAKNLLPKDPVYVVPQHLTGIGRELLKKYSNVKKNPFF
jgi:hypothetical protein